MEQQQLLWGTGRRKSAVARVKMTPGNGTIIINGRPDNEYFKNRPWLENTIREPFKITQMLGKFDVKVRANGGGVSGQAGAIRHAVSRALLVVDPRLTKTLRKAGFLTRDPRMKERKKYGQRSARARFQFSKR